MKLNLCRCVRNVSTGRASAMLEDSSLVASARTIIATPVMDRTLANLPPKFGHRGNPGKVQRHSDAPHKRFRC